MPQEHRPTTAWLLNSLIPALISSAILIVPARAESGWSELRAKTADLVRQGRFAEAERILLEGIHAARRRGETGRDLAAALNELGTLYHDSGRLLEAERAYKESIAQSRRLPGAGSTLGTALGNLAGLRLVQKRLSEAEKLWRQAETILESMPGVTRLDLAFVYCGLADVYWETGRDQEAEGLLRRVLPTLEDAKDDPKLGAALILLGKIAWNNKREAEAERLVRRAVEVWRTTLGPQHPTYASGLTTLAVVLSTRSPEEATRLFQEVLEAAEARRGPAHVITGFALVLYARHLHALGKKREAKDLKRRGEAIFSAHSRENLSGHTLDIQAFQGLNAR